MVSLNATAPFFVHAPLKQIKISLASFRYIDCYNISERIPYRFRLDFYAEIENISATCQSGM